VLGTPAVRRIFDPLERGEEASQSIVAWAGFRLQLFSQPHRRAVQDLVNTVEAGFDAIFSQFLNLVRDNVRDLLE
jgi:hypothetical protein